MKKPKVKTVYCLRVRDSDDDDWKPEETFLKKKERNETAAYCRILGGLRTHSYERKETEHL